MRMSFLLQQCVEHFYDKWKKKKKTIRNKCDFSRIFIFLDTIYNLTLNSYMIFNLFKINRKPRMDRRLKWIGHIKGDLKRLIGF